VRQCRFRPYATEVNSAKRIQRKAIVVKRIRLTTLRILDRLGGREPVVFIPLLLIALGAWGFINVAEEVMEGDTRAFDEWVLRSLRAPGDLHDPIGPDWIIEFGLDVTALGGNWLLVFFTVAVAGYLWLDRKYETMLLLVLATSSGLLVSSALKSWFQRPRPDVVPHLADVLTSSFPSSHSLMSAVVYLTLGALLSSEVRRRSLKFYILFLSVLLAVVVGASRVYLGVHYPTDVLAGWCAGLSWALLFRLIARWLLRHRRIDSANPESGEPLT
jgi:undecaprenyl-diphosphatase